MDAIVGSAGNPMVGQRQAQVYEELECLENEIGRLESVVKDFEGRLDQITREPSPQVQTSDKQEEKARVPLAKNIQTKAEKLSGITNLLLDISNRLEI